MEGRKGGNPFLPAFLFEFVFLVIRIGSKRFLLLAVALLVAAPAFAGPSSPSSSHHWSLRPCIRPIIPQFEDVTRRDWVCTPVDAFILDRLGRAGLRPNKVE
jgi:hypothetical protein